MVAKTVTILVVKHAAFWMPLIALYAGARLEEIGLLLVADIREENGILSFDFIEIDDEDETAGTTPELKDLKTPNSRRQGPVHRCRSPST